MARSVPGKTPLLASHQSLGFFNTQHGSLVSSEQPANCSFLHRLMSHFGWQPIGCVAQRIPVFESPSFDEIERKAPGILRVGVVKLLSRVFLRSNLLLT